VGLILRDVEVAGRRVDVRIADGVVASVGACEYETGDEIVDGRGGVLLAGLHDEHVHVLALAAARASVDVSPAAVGDATGFERALRDAASRGPVRAVGFYERVFGDFDRDVLDALVSDTPVQIQHRTGELWVLNTRALKEQGAERVIDPHFERDANHRLTGRVWRGHDVLRTTAPIVPESIAKIGQELAAYGVTSITDATPTNDASTARLLSCLPQRVRVMGPLDLAIEPGPGIAVGEVKVLLDDDRLPGADDLASLAYEAHVKDRAIAVHCVTLVQLRFAIEVFRRSGVRGDRIEHGSVAPADAIADMHDLGLRVTTQPAFVGARGDDYLADVDKRDLAALYPVASLLAAGVPTFGSSDAPFGPLDPWVAMRAAVERKTPSGQILGAPQRVDPATALALYNAGSSVVVGAPADLVLLSVPLDGALERLSADDVVITIIAGNIVYDAR